MEVTIHVPDTLMQRLQEGGVKGLPRHVVEGLGVRRLSC